MKGLETARLSRGAFRANDGDIKLKVPCARGSGRGAPGQQPKPGRRQGSPAAGSKRAGQRAEMGDTMGVDGGWKASRPPNIIRS